MRVQQLESELHELQEETKFWKENFARLEARVGALENLPKNNNN